MFGVNLGRGALGPWTRRLVTLAVLLAVISPAFRSRDSYPLSTYPVYATARARTGVLHTAVGVLEGGGRDRLSLAVIADTDDPLIAEDRVADAVRDGRADVLCDTIAGRARQAAAEGRLPQHVAIEVVSEELDFVLTTAEKAPPLSRTVHARCEQPT